MMFTIRGPLSGLGTTATIGAPVINVRYTDSEGNIVESEQVQKFASNNSVITDCENSEFGSCSGSQQQILPATGISVNMMWVIAALVLGLVIVMNSGGRR